MLIALTGGIGAGKSTAAKIFVEFGFEVISADNIAKTLLGHVDILHQITAEFGACILNVEKGIDKKILRKIIFSDPKKRKWLEQLIHPRVWDIIRLKADEAPDKHLIVEIPLLTEKNSLNSVNYIIAVDCTDSLQIKRASQRDGTSAEEVQAIMTTQISRTERISIADFVLDNSSSVNELSAKIYNFLDGNPFP